MTERNAYVLVAMSFYMSWVSDSVSLGLGGSWAGDYVVVPIQIGCVLAAILEGRRRLYALALLGPLSAASALMTFPDPEVLVWAMGSAAVVVLARGLLRWPIYFYYGGASAFYLLMLSNNFTAYMGAYQACRLGAFTLFTGLVIRGQHGRVHN